MKQYTQKRVIAHFKSRLYFYYSQRAYNNNQPRCEIAWLHVTNHLYHGFPS